MNSIDNIVNELLVINSDISKYMTTLERERGEITGTIAKVQSTFGDHQAGQRLVLTLYKTLQTAVSADNSLYTVCQEICKCIQNLKK